MKTELPFAGSCGNVGVFLVETFHTAGGVDQFLFAGEERVATGANFNAQHVALDRGASLESMPTGTVYSYWVIVGMNTGFHDSPFCRVRSARRPRSPRELQPRR
jgi:hypothetical protein